MNKLLLAAVLSLVPVAASHAAVIISEVDPTGSSTTTYGQDWFELTNTGTAAVDLTGWKMDDNSYSAAVATPLRGVTSLPAGGSVVFIENSTTATTDATIAANFISAWFGTTPPANLAIGFYGATASGVSLSSNGDGVILFDANSAPVTGIGFGASMSGFTFDNRAGLGSTSAPYPTLSTLSVAGTNGAFLSPGGETGSPGAVPEPASLAAAALAGLGLLARRRNASA